MHLTRRTSTCAAWGVTAALAVLIAPLQASGAEVEDFYKGKTLSVLIGYSVGGGYDAYGRLVARHLGKHIPGNPNVQPQNMTGAGSLKAARLSLFRSPEGRLRYRHVLPQPGHRATPRQSRVRQH